ncbi:hypothetical protein AOC36_01515 [Erysipelothrix larvae]|uniref:RNA polymerase subunit sigma-24 n=1 Tax=Erysipelothrix larvae TaxID=1514105 RepID=A0A0X8GYF4_9FIRM|nr:sigma-70 family RNA polymerase sigma factor [Erysipelothrix larvae]AMC92710.1 hypothetical protein AOC36_01515 [Erysipelothrix larvae]
MPFDKDREVVEMYKSVVYGIALVRVKGATDADDIFQEVFMAYFKRPRVFLNEGHRKGWLIKTTMICCQNYIKNKRSYETLDEEHISAPIKHETHQEVIDALFSLDETVRTVIYLYYFEDYKTKEIASLLGRKESTVRMQMKRGRASLKAILEESNDEEERY